MKIHGKESFENRQAAGCRWQGQPGSSGRSGNWPSLGFNGGVTFTGTKAYDLSNGSATYYFGTDNGASPTELRVDDVTKSASTDLKISGKLVDAPIWYDASW